MYLFNHLWLGLWIYRFLNISSADMNRFTHFFLYVYTRVSLTYMVRCYIAMSREKAQDSTIIVFKGGCANLQQQCVRASAFFTY